MSYFVRIILVSAIYVSGISAAAYAAEECESWESGYSIASITEDGFKVKLNDGSMWRVEDPKGAMIADGWQSNEKIEICNDNKLHNTDEDEAIHVRKLQ